jgi:hypothetical protein
LTNIILVSGHGVKEKLPKPIDAFYLWKTQEYCPAQCDKRVVLQYETALLSQLYSPRKPGAAYMNLWLDD